MNQNDNEKGTLNSTHSLYIVQGFWGVWVEDQTCSIINGQCQRNRRRSCSNPQPKNDVNACGNNGADQVELIACTASQCSRELIHFVFFCMKL